MYWMVRAVDLHLLNPKGTGMASQLGNLLVLIKLENLMG